MIISKNKKTAISALKAFKRGEVRLDHPSQRASGQWSDEAKSLLIDSMMKLIIPSIIVVRKIEENGKKTDWVVDGKQRYSNTFDFLNDVYPINEEMLVTMPDGEVLDMNGRRFSEMPEYVQEMISNYDFDIVTITLEDGDDEDAIVDDIFLRYNNGVPVSKEHKALVSANKKVQTFVQTMVASNPLFTIANFSKNAIKKSEREATVLHSLILLSGIDFKSFSATDTAEFFKGTDIENSVLERCEIAMTKLSELFEEKHKMLSKVNIPMFTELMDDLEGAGEFLQYYVDNTLVGDKYRNNCSAGSIKKEKVTRRRTALVELFDEYTEKMGIVEVA